MSLIAPPRRFALDSQRYPLSDSLSWRDKRRTAGPTGTNQTEIILIYCKPLLSSVLNSVVILVVAKIHGSKDIEISTGWVLADAPQPEFSPESTLESPNKVANALGSTPTQEHLMILLCFVNE